MDVFSKFPNCQFLSLVKFEKRRSFKWAWARTNCCPTKKKWYLVIKIVLNYVRKNCSIDREKLLKLEAEGREFAKILRSLEQFIQTVKGENNFW